MIVLVPVTPAGLVDPRFGKAAQVALADVDDAGALVGWEVLPVGWDVAHDQGTHGSHHARIVRVLRDNEVAVVAAAHIGEGMLRTLKAMNLPVVLGCAGPAQESARAAAELVRTSGLDGSAETDK